MTHVPVLVLFIPVPMPHDVQIAVWDCGPLLVTYLCDEKIFTPFVCRLLEAAVSREAELWARLGGEPDPTPTSIRLAS